MKKIKNILLTFSVLMGIVHLGLALPVHAGLFDSSVNQACNGAALGSGADCNKSTAAATSRVDNVIKTIVNIITVIVGIAAVIIIIINGLKFVTANGDANSITAARNGIIYAIVGLIIVAFAQLIVRYVLNRTAS